MRNYILIFGFAFFTAFQANAACVSGDCDDGFGTYVWQNGDMYVGFWKNGSKHYFGMHFWKDGDFWYGLYKDGNRKPGNGLYAWDDGTSETRTTPVQFSERGCVSGDCKNGWGVYVYQDGDLHAGYWKNGKQHFFGAKFWSSGDFYLGLYKNGDRKTNRQGFYAFNDGRTKIYVDPPKYAEKGCVEGNCDDGFGTYIWDNGDYHTGFWKDKKQHYIGLKFWGDNDFFLGIYKDGKRRKRGLYIYEDGTKQMRNEVVYFDPNSTYLALNTTSNNATFNATNIVEDYNTNHSTPNTTTTSTPSSSGDGTTKVWALIVGVADYNHINALKYTDDDAYRVANFLQRQEGGAIPDEQLTILIDESATKNKIINQAKSLFSQADGDDVILFYFSGHGTNGAFLPRDFDGYNNKLPHSEIRNIFNKSKAKHKICIADACHSGSLDKTAKDMATVVNTYYDAWNSSTGGTALMMSSKAEETSIEFRGLRQGVFSYFLIKGLKGEANSNGDKIVTITELYNYIDKSVRAYTGNKQNPVINGNYDKNMPIAVMRN
jgi:hypothetical protein